MLSNLHHLTLHVDKGWYTLTVLEDAVGVVFNDKTLGHPVAVLYVDFLFHTHVLSTNSYTISCASTYAMCRVWKTKIDYIYHHIHRC
jgi:hypothetical protein